MIEAEIVPRLMLAAQDGGPSVSYTDDIQSVRPADVDLLVRKLAHKDATAAEEVVAAARARGVRDETVFIDLIAPAARELGRMWEDDDLDFAAVTIAVGALHMIVRHMSCAERVSTMLGRDQRRVLLAPACGDQHILGLTLAAEFCRRAGWDVWPEISARLDELTALLRREWFDVIGLTSSRDDMNEQIAAEVRALRAASKNQNVRLVIGGRVADVYPDLACRVGADRAISDVSEVASALENLCSQAARQ